MSETREQMAVILRAIHVLLEEHPEQHTATQDQITESTGIEYGRVGDLLAVMANDGLIWGERLFGGWIAGLTAKARLALENGEQEPVTSSPIGF